MSPESASSPLGREQISSPVAARFPFWPTVGTLAAGIGILFTGIIAFAFVYGIALAFINPKLLRTVAEDPNFNQFCLWAGYIPVAGFLLWRLPKLAGASLRSLGLRAMTQRDGLYVVLGIIAVYSVKIMNGALLEAVHQEHHKQTGFENIHANTTAETIVLFVTLAVIAPFAEELFFRALLVGALREWSNLGLAIVVSSALFAAVHADLLFSPSLFALGAVVAYVYYKTGNLVAAMAIHAINNAIGVVFLVASG